jgi:nitrogen fixation-related uncharacterized protein
LLIGVAIILGVMTLQKINQNLVTLMIAIALLLENIKLETEVIVIGAFI